MNLEALSNYNKVDLKNSLEPTVQKSKKKGKNKQIQTPRKTEENHPKIKVLRISDSPEHKYHVRIPFFNTFTIFLSIHLSPKS